MPSLSEIGNKRADDVVKRAALQVLRPDAYESDDAAKRECEQRLYSFVKYAWPVVESQDYVDNWHIEAICDHLQAVTEGKIQNLLINQPPGTSKSLITCVFWPMWEWGPRKRPWVRWFFSSYDQRLSTRDSVRCRTLLESDWFSSRWPIRLKSDQNQKTFYETDQGGYRLATSVLGHGTGEHPDRKVCLPWESRILTDQGMLPIGDVVERCLPVKVLGMSDGGELSWQEIEAFEVSSGRELCRIVTDDGSVELTGDHPVFVVGRGYVGAIRVVPGDVLFRMLGCLSGRGLVRGSVVTEVVHGVWIPEKVYNVRVAPHHNYFAEGVLVHNCDDPHNVNSAESEVERESTIRWYDLTMSTRGASRKASDVAVMQRLHEGDLSGHILAKKTHVHLCLPMRYEPGRMEDTPLGWNDPRRTEGELLTPKQFPEAVVAKLEKTLGLYGSAGQLQQRPTPASGGIFKREWFGRLVDAAPRDCRRVRYWDKAGTAGGGAYTAGVLVAEDSEGRFFVEDIVRGQWEARERENIIAQTADMDGYRYGNQVVTWVEQEPGSSGKDVANYTKRRLAGHIVEADKVTGDKVTRARPLASQFGASNVMLVRGEWNAAFVDECVMFPAGKYKDQVDSASGGFSKLSQAVRPEGWFRVHSAVERDKVPLLLVVVRSDDAPAVKLDARSRLEVKLCELNGSPRACAKTVGEIEVLDLGLASLDARNLPDYATAASLMTRDDGKQLWRFLLRKRPVPPGAFFLVDDSPEQARAKSVAYALADAMFLERDKAVWVIGDDGARHSGVAPPDLHIYDTVRSSRAMVVA